MSLFDLLDKWITERGSSVVLRERLGLCHDEKAVLARQVAEAVAQQAAAQQKAADAQAANDALAARVHQLEVEKAALERQVADLQAEAKRPKHFAELI